MNILVINGPNLNMLGRRDPDQYGSFSYDQLCRQLEVQFPEDQFEFYQSNNEGELINRIHQAVEEEWQGCIGNFGGYTHTSVAIRDALALLRFPIIEVHLSNIHGREEFRHVSITAGVCSGVIAGFGAGSYSLAVMALREYV